MMLTNKSPGADATAAGAMTLGPCQNLDQDSIEGSLPQPDPGPIGLTLAQYATAKKLDVNFLRTLGLSDIYYLGTPALRIPYRDADGGEVAVRFRLSMDGPTRFVWRKGSKPIPYGLDRLDAARAAGYVILVEGESDAHTLWQHGLPALGLPGSSTWREDRDAHLLGEIGTIYVVQEPDGGGATLIESLASSSISARLKVTTLSPHKDSSSAYISHPELFIENVRVAMEAATPIATTKSTTSAQDYELCRDLASSEDVLGALVSSLQQGGAVGEDRNAKVLYLALTSRLLPKPVNIVVKGPSSAGKSFLVDRVRSHFPEDAYVFRTTFSEHALIYSDEPYAHRHLIIAEASGAEGPKQEYLIRTLLSEGRIEYETVEKLGGMMVPRRISKEGPTGLIVTTTRPSLHAENETRLLSLSVLDTKEQTRAVIQAIAAGSTSAPIVPPEWPALQRWLAAGETRVAIPFAKVLGSLTSPAATRVRRDFTSLLSLIMSHALVHRDRRERDDDGRILAQVEDYAAVYDLVADLFAQGVAKTVKPAVRETVEAVRHAAGLGWATNKSIAERLAIDEAASSRRCREAMELGYIVNEEDRKGRPAKYKIARQIPDDEPVLPKPTQLLAEIECRAGGDTSPGQEVNRSIDVTQGETG